MCVIIDSEFQKYFQSSCMCGARRSGESSIVFGRVNGDHDLCRTYWVVESLTPIPYFDTDTKILLVPCR